jgi:hypothetical protein
MEGKFYSFFLVTALSFYSHVAIAGGGLNLDLLEAVVV